MKTTIGNKIIKDLKKMLKVAKKATVGSKIVKELKKAGFKTTTIVIPTTKADRIRFKEVTAFLK